MRPRPAQLALASSLFALIMGVAGWFWCQVFTEPASGLADRRIMVGTTIAAALAGAVAGLLLAPAPSDDGALPRPSAARITCVIPALGALVGGVGGAQHAWADIGLGAGCGFLASLPLIPIAALAITALRRVGRARRGSIVARADARALAAVTAGALGCASGLAAVEWPAAEVGAAAPPLPAVALLIAAAALIAASLLTDIAALARVDRWASRVGADAADPLGPAAAPAGHLDLGLGEDITAAPVAGTPYRGGGRPLASVAGDIDEARAALRQSIRRGAVMLVFLEAIGFGHGIARSPEAAARYDAWLCDEGRLSSCRSAALLAERAGLPGPEAERLHRRACDNGQDESCLALEMMRRLEGPPW